MKEPARAPGTAEMRGLQPSGARQTPAEENLAIAEERSKKVREELADAETRIARQQEELERQSQQLKYAHKLLEVQKAELAKAARQVGDQQALSDKQAELARVAEELRQARGGLASAISERDRLRGEAEVSGKRLLAVTEELAALRAGYEQLAAAARKTQTELAAVKEQQARTWTDLQRAYLSAAAPGQEGFAARQAAVRRSRMVERCSELRPAVPGEATRRLFDQLEVVLTRLEMLDVASADAVGSFAKMVHSGDLLGQMDQALAAGVEAPQARAWLFEARLILTGADRVG